MNITYLQGNGILWCPHCGSTTRGMHLDEKLGYQRAEGTTSCCHKPIKVFYDTWSKE